MKKAISYVLTVALFLGVFFALPCYGASDIPSLEAEACYLIDMNTGEVLYQNNANSLMYPASTTKMMTGILAIEMLDMNTMVTVDDETASVGGTSLGLKSGEEISVKDLLNAMLVMSANDCAAALAKEAGGNIESFVLKMNQKALSLGCRGTNFVNPHGLHDENHYSTAEDLAVIARYCMQNDTFRQIVCQPEYTVPATNKSEARTVTSTNLLLFDENDKNRIYVNNELRYCKYDDCIGIKTGYTPEAQGCLVSAAQKHGTAIISVVLKSSSYGRYADSIKLLDWGFDNFRTLRVIDAGTSLGAIKVKKGEFNTVGVKCSGTILATIPQEASDAVITKDVKIDEDVTAPVAKGQTVGTVTVYESGEIIATCAAVAAEGISQGGILSNFGIEDAAARKIGFTVLGIFALLFLSLVAYVLFKRRQIRIKKARRAAKIREKQEAEKRRRRQWELDYDQRYKRSGYDGDDR